MDKWALEKHARIGIEEAVAWYTVTVDTSFASTKSPCWGTGSLLEIEGRFFVLTCKHLVKTTYKNKDLRFIYRSERALKQDSKEEVKRRPIPKIMRESDVTFAQQLPIINRFYSDEVDDLVLLEIEPSSQQIKDYRFFKLVTTGLKTPEPNSGVYLTGFSVELARRVTKYNYGVFPYFLNTGIIDKDIKSENFNPNRHFLMDFTIDEDSVDSHGLSGAGVWSRKPSGKGLWTPNIYLVGVQSSFLTKSQLLKATRVERLVKLVDDFLRKG